MVFMEGHLAFCGLQCGHSECGPEFQVRPTTILNADFYKTLSRLRIATSETVCGTQRPRFLRTIAHALYSFTCFSLDFLMLIAGLQCWTISPFTFLLSSIPRRFAEL